MSVFLQVWVFLSAYVWLKASDSQPLPGQQMLYQSFQSDAVWGTHDWKSNIFSLRSYSKTFLKSLSFWKLLLRKVLEHKTSVLLISWVSTLGKSVLSHIHGMFNAAELVDWGTFGLQLICGLCAGMNSHKSHWYSQFWSSLIQGTDFWQTERKIQHEGKKAKVLVLTMDEKLPNGGF